jgi:hypothetical protein
MPGDYDIEYTSPWAGANYQPSVMILSLESKNCNIDWEVVIRTKRVANGRRTHGQSLLDLLRKFLKLAFTSRVVHNIGVKSFLLTSLR